MATKVRGITIELGADASGISKALSDVNKDIGSTQRQLKDVERLLKLDPTNTELLEQKQRLLGGAVDQTKTKLEALVKAQVQVGDELSKTGQGQEQYDALTREIASCEQELIRLQVEAEKTGDKVETASEKLGKFGEKAKSLADKTKKASIAAAGLAGGLIGTAIKAGKTADDINTLSKTTGLATDTIQKLQYASDLVDVSFDTVSGSLVKLTNNMQSAQSGTGAVSDAFDKLGVSVTDGSGQLRDNEEVFYEVIDALGQIENETERDALAMDIFGKSATDLNPLILDGADSLKQLGEQAEASGLILSQDALDGANQFNDALDTMKATVGTSLLTMGADLAETLTPALEKLSEVVATVCEWITSLDGDTLAMIVTIAGIVAAITPVISLIGTITTVIQALIPVITALNAVMLANPIGMVIALIAALIAIFVLLYKNWDKVKEGFSKGWQAIKDSFSKGWENCKRILSAIGDGIKTVFSGIWNFIKGIINGILSGVETVVNGVIKGINFILGGISKIANAVGSLIGLNPINLSLNPVSLPRLAKGGTVLDGNAIVGEAGAELLSVSNGAATVTPLTHSSNNSDITGLLQQYLPYLAHDQNIYLNGKTLVGGIINDVNSQLGIMSMRGSNR